MEKGISYQVTINTINHDDIIYPAFQAAGFAARFAFPFAKEFCKGRGYDIGCSRTEWAFPGAMPIDVHFDNEWEANNLPDEKVDYIFSSHCLEHIADWTHTLNYWKTKLKSGGILFLYLPDYSQTYWRPWNNRKHVNVLTPEIISDYLHSSEFRNIFVSGVDLNNSFMAVAEKT